MRLDDHGGLKLTEEHADEKDFLLSSADFEKEREKMAFFESRFGGPDPNLAGSEYLRKLWRHMLTCFFIVAHLVANTNYLWFKATLYSNNLYSVLTAPWLLVLMAVEMIYFGSSIIAAMDNFLPPSKRPDLVLDGHYYPTVHILVPCCKEPTDIPVESIRAALKMDYPTDRFKVLVLDDGGDDELKAQCQALGADTGGQVVYLRRKKFPGVPHHFKCGNMNFGLSHSNSEYVVMMDADMILHPSFLRKLLPHIVNSPDISFVQIPQAYYNLPFGDPLNDSSILGYDKVLVHRDTLGCATCIGTGCLFRRKHLNAIGGFQPQSITEDTTTAYSLFKEGYRSVYLNEKLQIGLVPWTFEGYVKQRCRWGQGAMQQFTATWRPMLGKKSKLNIVLKVLYFWHSGYYFLSIVNLFLVGSMLGALLFRWRFTVGTEQDSRKLIETLCYNLIFWRISWMCLWWQVPCSLQSRNRDESHFWWMTPFFAKMIFESCFDYKATFKFVPTSNIDRNASKGERSALMKQLGQLKHVKFHLFYTIFICALVAGKIYVALTYYGLDDCAESFYVFGISFFLVTTCAHMMLPVMYIIWPTNFKSADRRFLLKYDADGVPVFKPQEQVPRWYWSVMLYEVVSSATFGFWIFVLWMVKTEADKQFCREGAF